MRICLVYDCLFPHTIGGAERWYRNLVERLATEGHEVTFLTLRQWDRGSDPGVPGVMVRTVGPRLALYTASGRRRVLPPLVFGVGVLLQLLRHGRRYDVIHMASFPYFSLLGAALARPVGRYRMVVDWHEVWTREYWREYLGPVGGTVGWLVQLLCARVPQRAFCFSELHAGRLREEGVRGEITRLGAYSGPLEAAPCDAVEPIVVFAGRHIPEKRVPAVVPAVARVRKCLPNIRAVILGDGPERDQVRELIARLHLQDAIDTRGFVPTEIVDESLAHALCLLLPSRREGYGLVVLEAASHGTPSVVVADPDNAAVELVNDGENGFVAPSASSDDLATAILRVHGAGAALRDSTVGWFERNAQRLSLSRSLEIVLSAYGVADEQGSTVA